MPTVRANDIDIYYEQQGSGEPLVLIPYLAIDQACYAFQGDRPGTMQRRTSSRPLQRLKGRLEVGTARATSLIGLDAPAGVRGEG